jgi:hypothetical protein
MTPRNASMSLCPDFDLEADATPSDRQNPGLEVSVFSVYLPLDIETSPTRPR